MPKTAWTKVKIPPSSTIRENITIQTPDILLVIRVNDVKHLVGDAASVAHSAGRTDYARKLEKACVRFGELEQELGEAISKEGRGVE